MNFEKWNLGFFASFHIGKLFRVKRLKWIALSLIDRISACQARCLACCFVWFSHHLSSPEISLFTHRCNNIHSFKSQVQDTKPKRRLDGQNMIRLKYIQAVARSLAVYALMNSDKPAKEFTALRRRICRISNQKSSLSESLWSRFETVNHWL